MTAPAVRAAPGRVAGDRTPGREPPAARCGPTAVLVVAFLPIAGAYGVRSWQVGLSCLAVLVALAPLATTWTAGTLVRLLPAVVAALSLGWSAWLFTGGGAGWQGAVRAASRVLVLVLPGVLLAGQIRPAALGDQLGQWFRVPARPVVAAMAALERLDGLVETTREAARVRRVRGLSAGRSPAARARAAGQISFDVLVGSIRDAGRMAVAMEARGLGTASRRSWLEPARWRRADTVLVVVGTISASLPTLLTALTPW